MAGRMYLDRVPPQEALDRLIKAWKAAGGGVLPGESVPVALAAGRILSRLVRAARSLPHYRAAAMDGIAVVSRLTHGASESNPRELGPGQFVPVDTGDPLPPGMDAVIMREDISWTAETPSISGPARAGQHVRTVGEDVREGQLLLGPFHALRPEDQSLLVATGVIEVEVVTRPRVTIIPTGDEVVRPGDFTGEPGQIVESNSFLLGGRARELGADVTVLDPVPDDPRLIEKAVAGAVAQSDLVVVNAGSSAGSGDFVPGVLSRVGNLLVHGVATRPGHPTALAMAGSVPVLGLPGYPVSCAVTFELFAAPLLRAMQGLEPKGEKSSLKAVLTRTVLSRPGLVEYVRVRLVADGDRLLAAPLPRGAGLLSSLVGADGMLKVPLAREGLPAGQDVDVELLVNCDRVYRSVHLSGGEDPMLSILSTVLARDGIRLVLQFPGSSAGMRALSSGEAHIAGVNLVHGDSEPDLKAISGLLSEPALVVNAWRREQGLYVQKSNGHDIMGAGDLARPGLKVAGRPSGSGTRSFIDRHLAGAGVNVPNMDEYGSARAVAGAVAGGWADVGIGIRVVALDHDLEFVPLGWETYHLVIPARVVERQNVQQLIGALHTGTFLDAAGQGYDMGETGNETWLEPGD